MSETNQFIVAEYDRNSVPLELRVVTKKPKKSHHIQRQGYGLPEPAFSLLFFGCLILCIINDLQSFLALWSPSQILISILGNQQIIFDANSSNGVILLEQVYVDEFGVSRFFEVYLFQGISGKIAELLARELMMRG